MLVNFTQKQFIPLIINLKNMSKEKHKLNPKLDLYFERIVNVPRELIWQAWTNPQHLKKWFCPRPWTTIECEIDLRAGGIFSSIMCSPDGLQFPNQGCYLEIIENEKLVWTSALLPGFRPAPRAISGADLFFTAIILLEPHEQGTKYTAIAMHKDAADCESHREMGFEEGWGKALDQLIEVTKTF
jgi:uncharacterized protein YndB with AHSA1/START domain